MCPNVAQIVHLTVLTFTQNDHARRRAFNKTSRYSNDAHPSTTHNWVPAVLQNVHDPNVCQSKQKLRTVGTAGFANGEPWALPGTQTKKKLKDFKPAATKGTVARGCIPIWDA